MTELAEKCRNAAKVAHATSAKVLVSDHPRAYSKAIEWQGWGHRLEKVAKQPDASHMLGDLMEFQEWVGKEQEMQE